MLKMKLRKEESKFQDNISTREVLKYASIVKHFKVIFGSSKFGE